MAEFVAVARRKRLLADDSIDQWLIFLGTCPVVPVDEAYVRAGFELPRGAFATVVLREIMKPEAVIEAEESGD